MRSTGVEIAAKAVLSHGGVVLRGASRALDKGSDQADDLIVREVFNRIADRYLRQG